MTTPLALTLDQAAERIGVSRRTLRKLVKRRFLAVMRIGHRTIRVRPSAIDACLLKLEGGIK